MRRRSNSLPATVPAIGSKVSGGTCSAYTARTANRGDNGVRHRGQRLGRRLWHAPLDREKVEIKGRISRTHAVAKTRCIGGDISDSETMIKIDRHVHAGDGLSVGVSCSFGRHTNGNFDNIRKRGVALRYHF